MRSANLGAAVLAVALPAGGVLAHALASDTSVTAGSTGPVITTPEPWADVPFGETHGELTMEDGCLLLDRHVVFWPYGTRWDEEGAVVFDSHPALKVGSDFTGGAGVYEAGVDYVSLLGADAGAAVEDCLAQAGAAAAVFAYPTDVPTD